MNFVNIYIFFFWKKCCFVFFFFFFQKIVLKFIKEKEVTYLRFSKNQNGVCSYCYRVFILLEYQYVTQIKILEDELTKHLQNKKVLKDELAKQQHKYKDLDNILNKDLLEKDEEFLA
jgi:hypothetical protein